MQVIQIDLDKHNGFLKDRGQYTEAPLISIFQLGWKNHTGIKLMELGLNANANSC